VAGRRRCSFYQFLLCACACVLLTLHDSMNKNFVPSLSTSVSCISDSFVPSAVSFCVLLLPFHVPSHFRFSKGLFCTPLILFRAYACFGFVGFSLFRV